MESSGEYSTPDPEALKKQIEQLQRPISEKEEKVLSRIKREQRELIEKRSGRFFGLGKFALRLGFDGSRKFKARQARELIDIYNDHRQTLNRLSELSKLLEAASFERLSPMDQAAKVEHAAWETILNIPQYGPEKLSDQENRLEIGGAPLDLSLPVSIFLPTHGIYEDRVLTFAGEQRLDKDAELPSEEEWMNGERGSFAGRKLYLTDAYTVAGGTFRIPINREYLTEHMDRQERWTLYIEATRLVDPDYLLIGHY